MPYRPVKTRVTRFWDEVRAFREMYRHDKLAALFLALVLAIYAGIVVLPQIPRPGTPPTMASPIVEPNQAGYPATIRNPLANSVRIAVGDGEFETLHAGAEMPVYAPKGGTTVRLYSCGGNLPCRERPYGILGGTRWEVVQEPPYPQVGLKQIL
jgi:hypothetical protein